jgi:hypothetical protein
MATISPAAPEKKSGCGCFGCGCAVLVVIALLLVGAVVGAGYMAYQGISAASSATPGDIPAFNATDEGFQAVQQKIATFQQALNSHQPATLTLTGDDLNNLLAHDPDITRKNIHVYASLDGNTGRIQTSIPSEAMLQNALKGRYFNIDSSFALTFDPTTKSVVVSPQTMQVGDKVLLGPNADNSSFATGFVKGFVPSFNQSFNQGLRKNPNAAALLDQAQTITIQNSSLVITTQ